MNEWNQSSHKGRLLFLIYVFQIQKEGERGSAEGSRFCRSSAHTGGLICLTITLESRQEIKQLHPSYLLNSSSLEDTCAGGQSCAWILKLWKRMFFSLHTSLSLLSTLQPHLPWFCFSNTPSLSLPPDFVYCCSLGLGPCSPALHTTGPTILQDAAQLWPLDGGFPLSSHVKSPSQDSP